MTKIEVLEAGSPGSESQQKLWRTQRFAFLFGRGGGTEQVSVCLERFLCFFDFPRFSRRLGQFPKVS